MNSTKLKSTTTTTTTTAATGAAMTMSNGVTNTSNNEHKRLFITHVDAFGPYLKISGQLNADAMALVHTKMQNVLSSCFAVDSTWQVARQQALLCSGIMCLCKRVKGAAPSDYEMLRTRILDVTPKATMVQCEVEFIDYGYTAFVSSYELLFPQHPDVIQSIPSLCSQYIVLGICKDWKKAELDEILRMIKCQTVDICIEMEFNQFKFITMKWKEFNFAEFLIHQKKIGAPIANDLLRDNFIKYQKQQKQQQQKQLNFYSTTSTPALTMVNKQHANNATTTNNNNNNSIMNNNYYSANNNNNHAVIADAIAPDVAAATPLYGGGTGLGSIGANQVREQMAARRSLAARLQQQQQQMAIHNMMHPVHPRVPHSIGNLRSMMQGIHLQNNRIPYTGLTYHAPPNIVTYGRGIINAVPATMTSVAQLNAYNARYQRPQVPPQPLVADTLNVSNASSTTASSTSSSTPRRTIATFKSNSLSVGKTYDVCVSFVENGPCLFSIQLQSAQDELTNMMNKIEHIELKQFTEKPVLGTACIARYSEDGQLYRALITGVQPTTCKVVYIDYGNAEVVNFRDLYEIPDEFLKAKVFAIRFTLCGNKELEPLDESLKKAFKDLVIYKSCKLKVMPLEGPPLVQYCELYMQEKSILDVLKDIQKCRLVYAKAEHLQNNDIVEIRYIDSPKHFYVQKITNIPEFEKLMDDMYLYYNKNQVVPNQLALGAPCIVKYENEWYRAEVMRADATAIVVRHVDFGYEQKVTKNLLSTIAEKHLKLPRQAVQCCLKGFENNELNKDLATTQFEMLAEESNRKRRTFTVKVFRIQPDGVNLVNLCTKDLNVMKKLYKLSMPFEQYLTLEKEEFNIYPQNGHSKGGGSGSGSVIAAAANAENGHKTPSVASSNEISSMHSSKKSHSVVAQQQKPAKHQKTHQQQQQQQRHQNNTTKSNTSVEWDKNSSISSVENRDSRSSSSEYKQQQQQQQQGKRQQNHQQQQQQRQGGKHLQQQQLNSSFGSSSNDRRSTNGSIASSGSGYNKNRGNNNNIPPRFQNLKHDNDSRRHNNNNKQSPSTPRNQQQQRPQNAPQGYSQPRNSNSNNNNNQSNNKAAAGNNVAAANRSTDSISTSKSDNEQLPSSVAAQQMPEEYVALDYAFPVQHIDTPAREEIIICWWVSPHQFFTQIKSRIAEFERLMREMQQFYKQKTLQQLQLKVGSNVVVRYRKDATLYRARILACNQMLRKYKVYFVDFGNQYTVTSEDIWQVEKRFADFPCMAYLCSFNGIISNYDHLYIIDRMDQYLPAGAALVCEYIEREHDMYYVNVNVNKKSLKEALLMDGIINDVSPDLRLGLLAGQQIRAKITSIRDMLNFKIQIEGCDENIKLLCSYDDVRYVKSNPDIARQFKDFYEDKSFVVNIKDVNDNKVILLRPLLPLLKEDIPTYIASYPIILETFDVRVVYIASSYRLYAQLISTEMQVAHLLDDMYAHYEAQGTPLENFEQNQVCAAKGSDGNWYRARILRNTNDCFTEVSYFDYGNMEKVDKSHLKQLEEKFYVGKSAYAVEINLPLRPLADSQHKGVKARKSTTTTATAGSVIANNDEIDAAIIKEITTLTLDQVLTVRAIDVRHNHLLGDIVKMPENKSLIDVLKEKQLIKGHDVDYMRKLLDKEKPNVLEYIEMVDLTLEDDADEMDKKHSGSGKSKAMASPKKKKQSPPAAGKVEEKIQKKVEAVIEVVTSAKEIAPKLVTPIASVESLQTKKMDDIVQSQQTPVPSPEPEPPVVDPYAEMEHAILSHCDNPTQFYVHPQEKLNELRKLQENLQIVSSSLPPLMSVINGAHCISLYSVDKQWYRAKIMDAELMVLQFIDYGNTDCVSDTSDIKEMSVFPDIEPLCMPCALPIKPNGTADWVDAANAIFNDSYSKVLHFDYIIRGDQQKRSYINLHIEGVNIAEKLIQDGFAKPLELVDSGENCFISHVNGITDFYIQYEKDSKALELIECYLTQFEKLKKLEKFEYSKIVAALFPDDQKWYRAKLLKEIPSEGYEVLFIDYGNTSISPECRGISEEIAKLPSLSKKCAIELPDHCLSWSDAAEEKFAEIAAMGETIFTVELRQPAADHAIVHLLIDSHNIVDDLESLCDHKPVEHNDVMNASFCNSTLHSSVYESGVLMDAIVSHVNSPCDFYIQFNKDAIRLEDMTSSLNALGMDALEEPKLGQLCAATFDDDHSLYRAKVLEIISSDVKKYRVVFIDFGNEAISTDLRQLPQDLQQLKEFAKRCKLENARQFEQLGTMATESFNTLVEECSGLVKVDIIDATECEVAVVKLYASGTEENLCEKLNHALGLSGGGAGVTIVAAVPAIAEKSNTCVISHAISPNHFYIQHKSSTHELDFITKTLKTAKQQMAPLEALAAIVVGTICCAYSTEDDCYYRGRIERILVADSSYELFLLDHGTTIVSSELRELPEELRSIPPLALKCKLNAVPKGGTTTVLEERFAALVEAHFGEIYEIESDDLDPVTNVHTVKLQVNYKDLAEELSKAMEGDDTAANDAFNTVPTLHECSVIHVNSPASFYIQMATDVAALEKITDQLLDAEEKFEPFTQLEVGALCAAQFPDDMAFYRSKIVHVLDEGKCEVHYLDFGNNSVTDQFRQLPESMQQIEPYGRHCALDVNFTTAEACAQFQTFIDSRFSETFQVEFLKTTVEPQICRLFHQDKNVANEITQLLNSGGAAAAAGGGDELIIKDEPQDVDDNDMSQ